MTDFCPHDLLRIAPDPALLSMEQENVAVLQALMAVPWVVVRRATPDKPEQRGCVPVGIRGRTRADRFAAWMDPRAVLESVDPAAVRHRLARRELPVFHALYELRNRWSALTLPWGPTGSVGFELASGAPAASSASDLDLTVRADHPLSVQQARQLLTATLDLPVPVDIQVETPLGAISLVEFVRSPASLMLRTNTGPMLTRAPWGAVPRPVPELAI